GKMVMNFHLPKLKSAPNGEEINWARKNGPSDPGVAFENHLSVNFPPQNGPLFVYRNSKGHKPLTRVKFLSVLATTLKASGRPLLQGRRHRISSTLEYLLLRNIPFDVVNVKGRWASDTFLIYLHCHTQILAPYMQAQPSLHEYLLRITLLPVR
ncbi:hypothetical protein PAXINDRAFT_85789, partial [Paxillus involutus ATCC 200175]